MTIPTITKVRTMTTEVPDTDGADRAARATALPPRRKGAATNRLGVPGVRATSPARRRHAALGARIIAGSLSAATAAGLIGAMAGGHQTGMPASKAAQIYPASVVAADAAGVPGPNAAAYVLNAPPVSRTATVPLGTSQAS